VLHGILHNHAGTLFHVKARDIYKQVYSHPEHGPHIKNVNLMKSTIMIATELLNQSTGKAWVDCELAAIVINMEVMQTPSDAALRKMAIDTNNLDCPRNMIRFFDNRCLDRLKVLHGERLGGCQNPGCTAYGADAKLRSCGGCPAPCQIADRPSHKVRRTDFARR
jgi:hypothetical protein